MTIKVTYQVGTFANASRIFDSVEDTEVWEQFDWIDREDVHRYIDRVGFYTASDKDVTVTLEKV